MRQISLQTKVVLLAAASVISVAAIAVICISVALSLMTTSLMDEAKGRAEIILDVTTERFSAISRRIMRALNTAATSPELIAALMNNNNTAGRAIGRNIMDTYDMDLVTFTDRNGNVVARAHSERFGDNLSSENQGVRDALATGKSSWSMDTGVVVKFALRGAVPVYFNGEIIGSASTGINLATDKHIFVDDIKENYGVDCSLYLGTQRITTTITDDTGLERAGGSMDDPVLLATVKEKGETFFGKEVIAGHEIAAFYAPLRDSDDNIAGMFFIGRRLNEELAELYGNTMTTIIIATIFIGICLLLAGLFIPRSIKLVATDFSHHISDVNHQVEIISARVLSASRSMENTASTQAATMEETTALMHEMASQTKENFESTEIAKSRVSDASQSVTQVEASMRELTTSMSEISKIGDDILRIVETINTIGFKTNLLALNAAVEAARAGEAGAGFAVVAFEVRTLAIGATEASRNTSELIEQSIEKIRNGMNVVDKTNKEFEKVVKGVTDLGSIVAQIAENSNHQSQGIREMDQAIDDMNNTIQHTAANAAELTDLSRDVRIDTLNAKQATDDFIYHLLGVKPSEDAEAETKKPSGVE